MVKFYKGLEAEFSGLSPHTSVQFTNKNIIFNESMRNKNMDVYSRIFAKICLISVKPNGV